MAAPQPFCDVLRGYRISLAPNWPRYLQRSLWLILHRRNSGVVAV